MAIWLVLPAAPAIRWCWQRRVLMSLKWPNGLHQKQVARLGIKYLKAHGIEADLGDLTIDIWIPSKQFPGRASTFLLAFRDSRQVTGELMFRDLARAAFEVGRGPLVLISIAPLTRQYTYYSEINDFDVIQLSDLKFFAAALRTLKSRGSAQYSGPGKRIAKALANASL